ncbi:MAG: hypothetical protein GY915_00065 [bacterium]|nr:hypothetical protein [bacterium]
MKKHVASKRPLRGSSQFLCGFVLSTFALSGGVQATTFEGEVGEGEKPEASRTVFLLSPDSSIEADVREQDFVQPNPYHLSKLIEEQRELASLAQAKFESKENRWNKLRLDLFGQSRFLCYCNDDGDT